MFTKYCLTNVLKSVLTALPYRCGFQEFVVQSSSFSSIAKLRFFFGKSKCFFSHLHKKNTAVQRNCTVGIFFGGESGLQRDF